MNTLRWMRVIGDTMFAVGAVMLVLFVVGLAAGFSFQRAPREDGLPAPGTRGSPTT